MKSTYHNVIREQSGIPLEVPEEELQKQELDKQVKDLSRSIHIEWLQKEPTQEFFKSLSASIDALETRARSLACGYHITNNHQEIIMLLVQAEQLRTIKQKYGSAGNNS